MKRFQFTLEKVLDLRRLDSMAAKQALGAAQRVADEARAAVEQARTDRIAFENAMTGRRSRRMTVREWGTDILQHEAFLTGERAAAERFQAALADVAVRRAQVQSAQQREKALEQLRDRQLEAHLERELAEDQAAVDEMAQTLGSRRLGV